MIKRQWQKYALILFCLLFCLCGCAPNAEKQNRDIVSGTSWIATDDGSQLVFNKDQSFFWYKSKAEKNDNYFAGTYEFYIGKAAMDYLTGDLAEYGVTAEEMQFYFDRNEMYSLENFICFSTNNQSFLLDGKEQLSQEKKTSYFGFLLKDGTYLDIANMDTHTYYGFSKE